MTAERAQLIKEIFAQACERLGEEREQFLAQRCGQDLGLRAAVDELLVADASGATGFLNAKSRSPRGVAMPAQVGRFRLIRKIGEGGMGIVFEAQQDQPRRTVALKMVRGAGMSDDLVHRFKYEVQILGQLKHTGIAQIYEAGTYDDPGALGSPVPYFAMEYIHGRPLLEFASERQLTVRQRLEVVCKICDAVHHAHQKGVIHRDLKPANILVEETETEAQPKILDFGVARATRSDLQFVTMHTEIGQLVGTLSYMSPEQVAGNPDDIDVRSDVYALGVMIYELLAGRLPYDLRDRSISDAGMIIRQREPTRLGAMDRALGGEIETIVAKALAKEKERRYQSAAELSADIRRFLIGEPIDAKRDSALYVLRKTIKRYRVPLAGLGALIVLLFAFSGVTWILWGRARAAAEFARKSEITARESLRDSLVAQARATRQTLRIGRRIEALDAIAKAAAIGPSPETRNEAIAAMALPDLRVLRRLTLPGAAYFGRDLERCAILAPNGSVTVVRTEDDSELGRIPAPPDGLREMYAGEVIGRFFLRVFDPTVGARRLEVWDFASGRLHWTVGDVPFRARFDISPDARRLAVGRLDQAIHIHDLESGSPIQRISLDRSASYVTFDPSGQRLALYHGNFERAEILDLRTEGRQPVFESDVISWSVAWRPDGAVIAGAAGQRVELWDVDARRTLGFLEGHEAQVVHIRFSSDGKMLLTDGWDGYAILWDAHTGHPLLRFNLTNPVLSADGRLVAGTVIDGLASRGTLFELDHALERRRLVGSGGPEVLGLARGAFDRSSGLLITAGLSNDYVRQNSGLRVFDVDRGGEIASLSGQLARCVSIATDGAFLLVGNENGVERWPVRRKEDQFIVGPPQSVLSASGVSNLDMSADGRTAIVAIDGQDEYRILDLQQPGESRRLTSESSGGSEYVRISPDGRWAAIAARGGLKAAVWDLTASTRVAELNGDSHLGMAFHPSASVLATGGADGLWLWETETWRLLRRARGTSALLDYSPDGRILASVGGAGEPFTVQLLDSRTLEEIARLTPPETYATTDLAFSPDGTLLAQITNRAGVVHLWDLRRIRSHLAEMDLDWQGPPYPQHEVRGAPISVTFDSNAGPQ